MIEAAEAQKLLVISLLDYLAVLNNEDRVRILYR
jgi:hypothetical protein